MMKVSTLALLLAVIWLTTGEATPPTPLQCNNEAAVKISHLFGLRHHLLRKQENVFPLMNDIQKAQSVLNDLQDLLNSTLEGTKGLEMDIENLSTPEMNRLELSQTCDATIPKDCCQIKRMFPSAKSGLYAIRDPCLIGDKLFSTSRLTVYCDMETDGGGWIVIQRRNASMGWVNFTSNWADYEKGFGDLDGEFWIGLKNIYELTKRETMRLQLSVWNHSGNTIKSTYSYFSISDATNRYALTGLSGHSGTSGYHGPFTYSALSSYYFQTYDNYDGPPNCPYQRQNGWWYYKGSRSSTYCPEYSNLNGLHQPSSLRGTSSTGERLHWRTNTYSTYPTFTNAEMKIRPQSCTLN